MERRGWRGRGGGYFSAHDSSWRRHKNWREQPQPLFRLGRFQICASAHTRPREWRKEQLREDRALNRTKGTKEITNTMRLQHTAAHCNTLQHTAAHCNTLQHTATHCNTLQHTTTHCNTNTMRWNMQTRTIEPKKTKTK